MIHTIVRLLRRLLGLPPARQFRRIEFVPEMYDVPELLDPAVVYVAGTPEMPKWAVLLCPCSQPHQVTLSLQMPHPFAWRVELGAGGPTIWPSIDVRAQRRCHFWLSDGRVGWMPDATAARRR